MMTSNFARHNIEKFPPCSFDCSQLPLVQGRRYPQLAYSRDLFTKCMAGILNERDYAIEYCRDVLDKLDPAKVAQELGSDVVLFAGKLQAILSQEACRSLVGRSIRHRNCTFIGTYIFDRVISYHNFKLHSLRGEYHEYKVQFNFNAIGFGFIDLGVGSSGPRTESDAFGNFQNGHFAILTILQHAPRQCSANSYCCPRKIRR
jgi:hypothetical protein